VLPFFRAVSGVVPLAGKLNEVAALRLLSDRMSQLERQHKERIERGGNPADVDREIAQMALTDVVTLFLDCSIESSPLVRLLDGLVALSAGSSPPAMLAPTVTRHRRPDSPSIEGTKGRLAAIMEFRQTEGLSRKAAAEWVARYLPAELKRQLGSATRAAVDSWLVKWGGQRGTTPGSGREGYLCMRAILADHKPTEPKLKKVMKVLPRSLAS
jgi:hypothetical protein